MAEDILNEPGCLNVQGITQAWYCFTDEITAWPMLRLRDLTYIGDFTFQPFKGFKKLDSDFNEHEFKAQQKLDMNGVSYENSLTGFIIGSTQENQINYSQIQNKQIVVLFQQPDGKYRILGRQFSGARFLVDSSSDVPEGGIPGDRYKVVFKSQSPAYYYLDDFPIETDPPGIVPAGIAFAFPKGQQRTSYRTGDEGDRFQNGYFDIAVPANPKIISQLDYSEGANAFYVIKDALTVNGVTSKTRFVGVDGTQNFPTTNNKEYILIDKLTGLGVLRNLNAIPSNVIWDDAIDNALAYSIVVDGITYSDWYLPSLEEYLLLFGHYGNNSGSGTATWQDTKTGIYLFIGSNHVDLWSSTTFAANTTIAYEILRNPNLGIRGFAKTTTGTMKQTYIFDARSLITAP